MYKKDYITLMQKGGRPNHIIAENLIGDYSYYLCSINPDQPTDIFCFIFHDQKIITIKEYILKQINAELCIHLVILCLMLLNYNNFYHLYYPCFSLTDNDCLDINTPMFFHFHIRQYEPIIRLCDNDAPWLLFYNTLNRPTEDIIEMQKTIQYEPKINLVQIYNTIKCHNLLIFDFNIQINTTNENNNLRHLADFIYNDNNPRYVINQDVQIAFLKETLNLWINYQNSSLHKNTSSFGSFRGEAIPWLHYKQKDKEYFYSVFKLSPVNYYNECVKIFLHSDTKTLAETPAETKTLAETHVGGSIEPYDQLKYNVTHEFIKHKINLPLAYNIFDNFYNGLLDKISFGVLYKDYTHLYTTLLSIYNKYTYKNHDLEYKTALNFINALLQHNYNINTIVRIKNFAHNGIFGSPQYNMLKTNIDKNIINTYVTKYYPSCKL